VSVTTAADLLIRAHRLAIELRDSHDPVTLQQWERFDVTLHRALHESLGADASYVPRGDPSRHTLLSAIRAYPAPLRPPADIPLTPAQAARVLNITERRVHRQIRAGHLKAVHDGDAVALQARDLDKRPDITPADPTDLHPLARVAVTLGALADQLHRARATGQPVLDAPGEAAATARHLLAIGRVAAARALASLPFADADRPFAIAQYTERTLDTLATAGAPPASLAQLRTVTPHPAPLELGDRLETALHTWTGAARADLTRGVPASEGVRFLGNQAVHLYAVTHQVICADSVQTLDPNGATTVMLTAAARAAQAAGPLWANLTTLTRPTLEYATASRALITVLDDVTEALQPGARTKLDTRRALTDMSQAATAIADLMAATRSLPEQLARSQLLHTPKNRQTVVDLHTHRRLLTRPAAPINITELAHAWTLAGSAAGAVAAQLHHVLSGQVDHPLRSLVPVERTL
jgi:hypothetical protein